jgi:plastocyanin
VIGVDHVDAANQQLDAHGNSTAPPGQQARVFEYTDFFARSVRVHQGDTLDFHFAIPDHLLSVAPNEAAARQQFPLFSPDETTGGEGKAIGSGGPKIELGPAVFANFFGPPTCGQTSDKPCQFDGSGPTAAGFATQTSSDWFVHFTAAPGTYTYFCHFHPGMRGTVKVVSDNVATQSQGHIDRVSAEQFRHLRKEAMALYKEANQVNAEAENEDSGPTVYNVHVGVTSEDRHVAIHDMLPATLPPLKPGDVVKYRWQSNVIHTVGFNDAGPALLQPFGADCYPNTPAYVEFPADPNAPPPACAEPEGFLGVEAIGDPGTMAPGSPLTRAGGGDSGLLGGADYRKFYGNLGASSWSITASEPGSFHYQCTVHDWMRGTINVS